MIRCKIYYCHHSKGQHTANECRLCKPKGKPRHDFKPLREVSP